MNEKRKNERSKLIAFTPVYDSLHKILLGYLGDLSKEGALLIGETPMEINTQITLMIDFPATPEFPARRLIIPVRVAWCRHEKSAQYYNTGFEFREINEQNKTIIDSILQRYQFRRVNSVAG
ncbi:MAG TPA: PilZ domain-containing protein [Anaerolineales bacterium]|nr:PilZ domain-containing protein [Anaerolineales bacterium]